MDLGLGIINSILKNFDKILIKSNLSGKIWETIINEICFSNQKLWMFSFRILSKNKVDFLYIFFNTK